ncbi:unnamed protein product [Kuraishia capsulata CBS 1993]|uniref:Uncharacterized protein n=1 Tax=Kuraishia capsulata CBS 1993 TaxID=1382522 RepID=W6MXR1_9ASCO|nr:uncharacterized protein KUCA_T00005318001 [Kuraishia capsulata CBS 1993]CDK29330.1 unnamed protein product [Kuraishia capsulata CBS 1993]
MESSSISTIIQNIYIPPAKKISIPAIPSHHPSLIVPDALSDVSHQRSCGCSGEACIKDTAWFYGPGGEVISRSKSDISSTDTVAAQQMIHYSDGRQL